MTVDIRVLADERELVSATNLFRTAMIGFRQLNSTEAGHIGKILEPGRTLGAFVDGELVATTDSAASTLTVPGGARVRHAAVTHVGVLPSHTRRGIASELLRHQLHELHAVGDVVATLRASEATIYERFGYGVASTSQTIDVVTARAALRHGVRAGGSVRLIDPAAAWDVLPRIYDNARPARPGTIDRPAVWWENQRLRADGDPSPRYVAVFGEAGAETGFARYHPVDVDGWFTSAERRIVVDDFYAPTPDAHGALLGFVLGLDLVDRVSFTSVPLDDPLPWLLIDRRAARVTATRDETWLRVLDVADAFASRSLSGDARVVIAVEDTILHHNSAVFELSADGVRRTSAAPELRVDVAALGALLLGGVTWRTLEQAGVVTAAVSDAVARADALFDGPWQAPHAGIYF